MKKKLLLILPFVALPVFLPIYCILDRLVFLEVFGCGCVPSVQTNLLHIPFNANDLRLTVFSLSTIALFVLGLFLSKAFKSRAARIMYCAVILLYNVLWTMWIVRTFMWN